MITPKLDPSLTGYPEIVERRACLAGIDFQRRHRTANERAKLSIWDDLAARLRQGMNDTRRPSSGQPEYVTDFLDAWAIALDVGANLARRHTRDCLSVIGNQMAQGTDCLLQALDGFQKALSSIVPPSPGSRHRLTPEAAAIWCRHGHSH